MDNHAHRPQDARERMHELCVERMGFFIKKLHERGYDVQWSTEFELFFEDKDGKAVHVDAREIAKTLKQELPYFHYFENDLKGLSLAMHSGKDKLNTWTARNKGSMGSYYPLYKAAHALSSLAGKQHELLPYVARQYEVEMKVPQPQSDGRALKPYLKALENLPERMRVFGSEHGFAGICIVSKTYPHTFNRMTAPSMHMNVSLWKDGKNAFAAEKTPYPITYGDRVNSLAEHCMRGIQLMQHEAIPAYLDAEGNNERRLRGGWEGVERLDRVVGKSTRHSVQLRDPHWMLLHGQLARNPDYNHIEDRLPGACSDPYLALTMSLAGLYIGVCRKQLTQWENVAYFGGRTERVADTLHFAPRRFENPMLKEVLGAELYAAMKENQLAPFVALQDQRNAEAASRRRGR